MTAHGIVSRLLALLLASALASGCAVRPSTITDSPELVMVKSCRIPDRSWLPWYTRWAEHLWVDYKHGGDWQRAEWNDVDHVLMHPITAGTAFEDLRWEQNVAVHRSFTGDRARRIAAAIQARAAGYPCATRYRAWPGPNSNSFLAWLAHEVDMPVSLPHTALGKNFTTWFDAGLTTRGTGIAVDTLPLGVEIGLLEGVELRLFGVGFGIQIWPPAIELPFLASLPGGL